MAIHSGTAATWRTAIATALLAAVGAAWCASDQIDESSAAELTQRARTLHAQHDYVAAGDHYARAVELLERQNGPADATLVEPLAGLAQAMAAAQQPAAAIEQLTRAVAIVRRSDGLYDERQAPLLGQLVDLHSRAGNLEAAAAQLAYMERVSESTHGSHSLQHTRTLIDIAAWQCRLGRFDHGRERYRRSIERLDARGAAEPLMDALLGLAQCSREELAGEGIATGPESIDRHRGPIQQSNRMSVDSPAFHVHVLKVLRADAERALRRAARLAESIPLPPERRVAVLLQAGDWFQAKDHTRTARKYYASAQAWARRSAGAEDPLAAPVQVLYPVPLPALRSRHARATVAERAVELEFTVRADGRVDNERVVSREPGKSAADATLQAVQVARFRPRMVNGKPVGTEGVRFRQPF